MRDVKLRPYSDISPLSSTLKRSLNILEAAPEAGTNLVTLRELETKALKASFLSFSEKTLMPLAGVAALKTSSHSKPVS